MASNPATVSEPLHALLYEKAAQYNRPDFIAEDPIVLPHQFERREDIEIAGFFAATLAWGRRRTIIDKGRELMARMDNAPYDFIRHHRETDLKQLLGFKHRTFCDTDLLYFVAWLRYHYTRHASLEAAFLLPAGESGMEACLRAFHHHFFGLDFAPARTQKHVATPARGSACKRLNMLLRWMVRHDCNGVDFGLWKTIKPAQLMLPLDLHVHRVALELGLMHRKQSDWKAVEELTAALRCFDPHDPCRFDFALFGMGVVEGI